MNLPPSIILLVVANLGLLWLLMAAPIGKRTLVVRRRFDVSPVRIWSAVHPLGTEANWHPWLIESEEVGDGRMVRQSLTHLDRNGQPIRRTIEIVDSRQDERRMHFSSRVVEDSALDPSFWSSYSESRRIEPDGDGACLIIEQTDQYRGLAFLIFRFFSLKREMRALDEWLQTGRADLSGWIEHPLMQVFLAVLSTLILWPFFGLNGQGLLFSTQLTVVIVLHELGHMTAYRAFGHKTARMIFIPLLGGIAIGGRPYASRFELANCALMGAGMSAFLVPIIIAAHSGSEMGHLDPAVPASLLTFLLVLGAFNILNLLPMRRFDGGQVLRQVFPTRDALMAAVFAVTGALVWLGWRIGIPNEGLLAGLSVFVLMSLLGSSGAKPREELTDMQNGERLLTGFGYYAALAIHGYGIVYACDSLFG